MNTPDYSQENAVIATNPAGDFGNIQFGTGATVTGVQALRDQFLNLQLTQSLSSQSGAQTRYEGVEAVASAFTDDGTTGLSSQIQGFFSSLSTLAGNSRVRLGPPGGAGPGPDHDQRVPERLPGARPAGRQRQPAGGSLVPEVNTLTSQIAALNTQISRRWTPPPTTTPSTSARS